MRENQPVPPDEGAMAPMKEFALRLRTGGYQLSRGEASSLEPSHRPFFFSKVQTSMSRLKSGGLMP